MNRSLIEIDDGALVSDDVMPYVFTINYFIVCSTVSLFGIAFNVINIVLFVRQGFKETINISLLGLAVSDLCSLVTLLWVGICYSPFFMYSELPILTIDLQHFSGGWTHVIFTRITGFITVFITFERCLCVTFPLKVKSILTPKRVKVIVILIYVVVFVSMCKNYFIVRLGWKFEEELNRTMLGNIYLDHSDVVQMVSYYMQLFYPISSFVAVVACTTILVSKINQRRRWRQNVTTTDKERWQMVRDRQVIKLVVYVAIIFIVSFTPSLCLFIGMVLVPGMYIPGKNQNLFMLFVSCSFTMEGVNSSVNIFVYYKTSSKYKEAFLSCFCSQTRLLRADKESNNRQVALGDVPISNISK